MLSRLHTLEVPAVSLPIVFRSSTKFLQGFCSTRSLRNSASRFPVRSPDSSISPVPLSRPTRHPLPSPTWDATAIDKGDPSRHIHCELAFVCPSIDRQTGVEATVTPPPEHHTRTAPQPQPSQNSRGQSPSTPTRPPANTGKHTPPASTARCERRAKRGGLYRFRS